MYVTRLEFKYTLFFPKYKFPVLRTKNIALHPLACISNVGRHTCGKCGKEYTLKHNLVRHVRFECGKDPQFQCPQCPYKAKQKGTLKSHVLLKHKDFLLTSGVKFGTSGRAGSIC
ncbi:hypothetical protein J6590_014860 [Homalodisca vitripennis]|nr:hypothetical protein J6590_014860 [Homalodisca vitripennis]